MIRSYTALLLLFTLNVTAQPQVQLQQVASGLGYIVDIAHAGDDRLFILARPGIIRIVQNGEVLETNYLNISDQVTTSGEMGALGLAFDPEFAENGRFYIHYNSNQGGLHSRISRFTAATPQANTVDASTEQILLTIPQPSSFHNGGDLDFGPDGTLYLTLGDSFNAETSQSLTHPLGSILRIDVSDGGDNYAIPADNPYATAGGDTLPEIWAKGLRNPFRFGFDALTGDIWIGDVGSTVWEEVNFWPAGDHNGPNFGWRCYEGFVPAPSPTPGCGPAANYVMPVAVHPTSGAWCSVIGGRVYRGSSFPLLYGRYIYSDYCAGVLYSLLPDDDQCINEQLLSGIGNGVTCIGENSALEMFLGRNNGILYRIVDEFSVDVPHTQADEFRVYPVPAGDRLVIEGNLQQNVHVRLFDATGRLINGTARMNSGSMALDVSNMPPGPYTLLIDTQDGEVILRRQVSIMR